MYEADLDGLNMIRWPMYEADLDGLNMMIEADNV